MEGVYQHIDAKVMLGTSTWKDIMEPDLSVAAMEATVMIEQDLGGTRRVVGTGFLVRVEGGSGQDRVVLITAEHVLEEMPLVSASIGFRVQGADHAWRFTPTPVAIRDVDGLPLWTAHPVRDVAAMTIQVSHDLAAKAIPLAYLANDETPRQQAMMPGDELLALGFPRGLASNTAGFPILRAGRIASYPVEPSNTAATFLMDFSVFPGNSGGPVFAPSRRGADPSTGFIAGILTQQVEVDHERLGIGIVTHARFVRETIGALDGQPIEIWPSGDQSPLTGTRAVAAETRATP